MERLETIQRELRKVKFEIAEISINLPVPKNQCEHYFDCQKCSEDEECGWCGMIKKCVLGDSIGATNRNCNSWFYEKCNRAVCAKYDNCKECIIEPWCGWCDY